MAWAYIVSEDCEVGVPVQLFQYRLHCICVDHLLITLVVVTWKENEREKSRTQAFGGKCSIWGVELGGEKPFKCNACACPWESPNIFKIVLSYQELFSFVTFIMNKTVYQPLAFRWLCYFYVQRGSLCMAIAVFSLSVGSMKHLENIRGFPWRHWAMIAVPSP